MTYDVERTAVRELFASPALAAKNADHHYWDGVRLDPARLSRDLTRWSTTERLLGELACSLWGWAGPSGTRPAHVNLRQVCDLLDDCAMRTALEALARRAGLLPPGAILQLGGAKAR